MRHFHLRQLIFFIFLNVLLSVVVTVRRCGVYIKLGIENKTSSLSLVSGPQSSRCEHQFVHASFNGNFSFKLLATEKTTFLHGQEWKVQKIKTKMRLRTE